MAGKAWLFAGLERLVNRDTKLTVQDVDGNPLKINAVEFAAKDGIVVVTINARKRAKA